MKTTLIAILLAASAAPNLLTGAQLRKDEKVLRSAVIRDGQAPAEGDYWDSDATAVIRTAPSRRMVSPFSIGFSMM